MVSRALVLALLVAPLPASASTLYVSPTGRDAWSGRLAAPNAAKTDGPLKTLWGAVGRFRLLRSAGPKRILLRGGTHFLTQPLVLEAGDSNLEISAFAGEKPVLSGGRLITGWKKSGPNFEAKIPDAPANWYFRRVRAGDGDAARWQIPARFPNFDPRNPIKGGWSFVASPSERPGLFGGGLGSIHTAGDWFEWKISVPTSGDYSLWTYYAAFNAPFGNASMSGRTQMQVDGGPPQVLEGLDDTGSWDRKAWSRGGTLHLEAGPHTLRWTNLKGGGLNLDAFALALDSNWTPPPNPGTSTHVARLEPSPVIEVQAEKFSAKQSKEGVVSWAEVPGAATSFEFKAGDVHRYTDLEGAEVNIFPAWGWVSSILPIQKIDQSRRQVLVEPGRNASQEIRPGNRYFISNVREELDAPSEWFFSSKQHTLTWRPDKAGAEKGSVVAPVLDHLIELRRASNISIRGLEFEDSTTAREVADVYEPDDAAIWMSGAQGCSIEGCRFRFLGGYALKMTQGASRNAFVGNEVGPVGEGGVLLSGSTADQPTDNEVSGNWMHDLGALWKHVAGVYCTTASGTRIAHNRFERLPRYAISFKSYDLSRASHRNTAEFNDILQTNLETNDTGAIETLGRDKADSGNVIQYNRILDVVGLKADENGRILSPFMTWGIYLDDYSSGTTVRGNIVARFEWGGGCIHGGKNNVFENNIFINGAVHEMRYQVRDEFMQNNIFRRNIIVFNSPSANLFMHTGTWNPQVLALSDSNLIWRPQGDAPKYLQGDMTPLGSWAKWQAAGYDAHSVIANPLFVDSAHDDYRLKPGSPALGLGFEPIPTEKIGLKGFARSWKR